MTLPPMHPSCLPPGTPSASPILPADLLPHFHLSQRLRGPHPQFPGHSTLTSPLLFRGFAPGSSLLPAGTQAFTYSTSPCTARHVPHVGLTREPVGVNMGVKMQRGRGQSSHRQPPPPRPLTCAPHRASFWSNSAHPCFWQAVLRASGTFHRCPPRPRQKQVAMWQASPESTSCASSSWRPNCVTGGLFLPGWLGA